MTALHPAVDAAASHLLPRVGDRAVQGWHVLARSLTGHLLDGTGYGRLDLPQPLCAG
jgi:hypothetical protein